MEEAWNKAGEEVEPELLILRDLDREDFEEIKAYDGDINQMTFAHVKNSKAFDIKDLVEIEDESTIDESYSRDNFNANLFSSLKKSEDGWNINSRFKNHPYLNQKSFSLGQ